MLQQIQKKRQQIKKELVGTIKDSMKDVMSKKE